MEEVPDWGPTNIWLNHREFSRLVDQTPGMCALLLYNTSRYLLTVSSKDLPIPQARTLFVGYQGQLLNVFAANLHICM